MKKVEGTGKIDASPPRPQEGACGAEECACQPEAEGSASLERPARLFEARRKFLIGGVGLSTFAVTLHSQPALAWGNGGGGPITALCSPVGSHVRQTKQCVGSHCDYYCNNGSHWKSDCNSRLSSCGFTYQGGCNVGQTLQQAICSAYQQSGYQGNPTWGGRGWSGGFGSQHYYSSGFGSSGSGYNLGWWTYQSYCDSGNLEAWLACGWLNAKYQPSAFGYTCDQFVHACNTVLTSGNNHCSTDVKTALCQTISSLCQQNRSPLPSHNCGGYGSIWTF